MKKTTFALASAIGAVSMLAISAVAQQSPTKPAAPAAPSTTPITPAPSTTDKTPAPEAKNDQPTSKSQDWRGKRKYGDKSQRRHHRARRGGYGGFVPRMGRRWRHLSEEDRTAFFEAKLAAIRAGLLLSEEQERLWPPVESAVRQMMELRQTWRERFRKEGRLDNPMDRLKRRGEFFAQRGAALQDLAAAGKPLYDTLSDNQKRRLRILTRGHRKAAKRRAMHRRAMRNHHRQWRGRGYHQRRGWHGERRWDRQRNWNRRSDSYRGHWQGRSNRHGNWYGRGNDRNWGHSPRRWNQNYSSGGLNRGNRMADWRNM